MLKEYELVTYLMFRIQANVWFVSDTGFIQVKTQCGSIKRYLLKVYRRCPVTNFIVNWVGVGGWREVTGMGCGRGGEEGGRW